MALPLLLRSGPCLQTVLRDLEAHLQVSQRRKGILQRWQEVFRVEGRIGQACGCGRFDGSDVGLDDVLHLAPPWLMRMSGWVRVAEISTCAPGQTGVGLSRANEAHDLA